MAPSPPRRSAAAAAAAAAAIARAASSSSSAASSVSRTASISSSVSSSGPARRAASSSPREHAVRLLTFNLWFEPLAMRARMHAIGALIERHRPAVVGFQEVTRESLALLQKQRWAQYYDCSAATARPFSEAYFVVLFSALPWRSLEALPFANTGMGRELLAARVMLTPTVSLLVATSHLESLPQFARTRVSQLRESLSFLSDRVAATDEGEVCLGAVLMGDTNLIKGDMALLDARCAAHETITVEEAKTGRATCRKCGEKIDKGARRVGKTAKDKLATGKTVELTLWFHDACFLSDKTATEAEKSVVRQHNASGSDDAQHAATRGLPPHWRDLWLSVDGNSEANGFTYDGKRNALIKNKAYQSRLDRVYFYAPTSAARDAFESIEMVGTEPITDGLWASDHFGLLTTFCFDAAVAGAAGTGASKRKRESRQQSEGEKEEKPASRRPSGSKHAPIELE